MQNILPAFIESQSKIESFSNSKIEFEYSINDIFDTF